MDYRYTGAELEQHLVDVRAALADEHDAKVKRDLAAEIAATERELETQRERRSHLLSLADNPNSTERGDGGDARSDLATRGDVDRGLRTIERHADIMSAPAADRLDALVRRSDCQALAARYLEASASPDYLSGFGVVLAAGPSDAYLRMSPRQHEAFDRVNRVVAEQRAMGLTPGDGGYALPFTLDPTIIATGDGSLNPYRAISRVEVGITNEWRGVSSAGVTAHRRAEGDESADDSPSDFLQPTVTAQRTDVFIPFGMEIGGDWPTLQRELARMIAEAKDVEEAASFTTGTGLTVYPQGVITGTVAYGSSDSVVETDTAVTFAIGDVYKIKQALPARHLPAARWIANPTVLDQVYQFAGPGSEVPAVMPDRGGGILGKPAHESSVMDSATTTGGKYILLVGNFSRFLIYDRVGMSIELIPNLLGASHRPNGMRGCFAYWRNSSVVLDGNAFRVLKVKSS